MANVGVILSGCGVYDGSEIHEAVLTLLALDEGGATYQCLAPNKPQMHVINHLTSEVDPHPRNILVESARIARGKVLDLAKVKGTDYDAIVLPGGFGAAKNLCDFAVKGDQCSVDPHVERVLKEAHSARRPIGFACISPVIAAKVFGELAPAITIGHDTETAQKINAMGARHEARDVDDVVVDRTNRIVSTACYMEAKSIREVKLGIDRLVDEILRMVAEPVKA